MSTRSDVGRSSFRGLGYNVILTTPSAVSCTYQSSSAICVNANSTATFAYTGIASTLTKSAHCHAGSSAKANCVADYESFTANSYCSMRANCGALSPSISATGIQNQGFQSYSCSFGPFVGIQANTLSFVTTSSSQ